ncbi:hypothetical protein [Ferrimonas kyonanensis]|nr:hypothetical protein [Ferrimonas kyonanensis]
MDRVDNTNTPGVDSIAVILMGNTAISGFVPEPIDAHLSQPRALP